MTLIWVNNIKIEVRLSAQNRQINAPNSNDKVEINAGYYTIRCHSL